MAVASEVQVAPSAPAPQPAGGDVPIPQVSSMGAQGVKPAPAGTIPGPLRPFSDQPNSAMSKVKERLRSRAAGNQPAPEKKAEAAAPAAVDKKVEQKAKPQEAPAPEADDEDLMEAGVGEEKEPEAAEPEKEEKAETPAATTDDKKKEKVNPWKIAKEHEARKSELERENLELKKLIPNAEARKAEMAEVEQLKKRNEELEKHMQFVDYQQSDEFKTKYEKPYKDQWVSSMRDLKGVTVETNDGERPIAADDLLSLVNMTKIEARVKANEMFGDFASDVMLERDKIRGAFDAQSKALDEAKQVGSTKSLEAMKAHRETHEKLNGEVHEIYTKAVDSITKDPRVSQFITPKDGDAKQNEILTKGLTMVDDAFKMNPMDPSLTPKQRETIVKKHAAVRFRAAGYGVLKYEFTKLQAEHAKIAAKLAEYEGTVPNRGGHEPSAGASAPASGSKMAAMQQRLRARATK